MPRVLMKPKQVEDYTGFAVQTLARWRVEGRGPRFIRASGRVLYDSADVDAWLDARRHSSTSEPYLDAPAAA